MSLKHIKALAFDVFGTVVDWRSGVRREADAFLARHGASNVDGGEFADLWRSRYQPAMEEIRSGRRAYTRLDVLHRENLLWVLEHFGLNSLTMSADAIDELNLAWHRLDPWPDVLAGLSRLKARFVIATLSNGNTALQVAMARRAGLAWDAILGADLTRTYKPAKECYLGSAEALSLRPAEMLMVAAHESDLRAARSCGFKTAYVPRPLEYGPGKMPPADTSCFDLIANDFLELARLLECA
jgi:2-haloacid dehalogenase